MTRVKHATSSLRRRKKVLKEARGQQSARSRLYRVAKDSVRRSRIASYFGRKQKKRIFRSLWITRIAAACKEEGVSYSRMIAGLKKAEIQLNRKALAYIATNDPRGFKALVEKAKA